MNTKEFIAQQLAKPFEERCIPDSLYVRGYMASAILPALTQSEFPPTITSCFNNDFFYERQCRFIGASDDLYPNIIIPREEFFTHNREYYPEDQDT